MSGALEVPAPAARASGLSLIPTRDATATRRRGLRVDKVTAHVDVPRGVVRVDGAASDVELLATMEALGKRAAVVTHTRGVKSAPSSNSGVVKLQLFMKLLGKQANCCS